MAKVTIVKRNGVRQRQLKDNKIFVARHAALYDYCREIGLIGHNTPYYERVTISMLKDKDVVGVLPLELACHTRSYTEIPLKGCYVEPGQELRIEDIRMGAMAPHTYQINQVKLCS